MSSLSEVGGQSLEYLALASALEKSSRKDSSFSADLLRARVEEVLENLNSSKAAEGFYADRLFVPSGIWASSGVTVYESTKLFYESLIKSSVQSGKQGNEISSDLLRMFTDAVDSLLLNSSSHSSSLIATSKTGLKFTREYDHSLRAFTELTCMSSEGCYLGAMLSLGARELLNQQKKKSSSSAAAAADEIVESFSTQNSMFDSDLQETTESSSADDNETPVTDDPEVRSKADAWQRLAEELTETCYQAALRNEESRLLPDRFCFDDLNEATNRGGFNSGDNTWEDQGSRTKDNEMR